MSALAYFITFTTYGTWLHGDKRNSVVHCGNGTKLLTPNKAMENDEKCRMKYATVFLDAAKRKIVLKTVVEHCKIKEWKLWAVHIQSNHVHVIVSAAVPVERVMTQLKAWATRKLRDSGFDVPRVWTKHGSTRYLNTPGILQQKIRYIIYEQDKIMEYYIDTKTL